MNFKKLMIATTALALGASTFAVAQAQTSAEDKAPAQPEAAAAILTIEEAMDIASAKVPGGTVVSAYLEDDDDEGDRVVYEVELVDQDGEKEVYIDAVSGDVIGMDLDTDDDEDPDKD
ncbi:peptidase YpeB-like protein [Roseibium hamelinense]|uniref:Peptidase YpeB-like protein n=2 Tax=Roseibium hamelinense TaxID=150831 RepID=A0A562T8M9_9HYPH|nr:peptidase YpeB-like protein [Roseibium hamelinense]